MNCQLPYSSFDGDCLSQNYQSRSFYLSQALESLHQLQRQSQERATRQQIEEIIELILKARLQ